MSSGGGDGRQVVEFRLSDSSVLKILKGDITQWSVDGSSDAIVNPANEMMLGGGGADGAIHEAAGPELRSACYRVREVRPGVRCPTGEARITLGFQLPASRVIHTVGPVYDTDKKPKASLRNAYRNSLRVGKKNKIQYIAFTAFRVDSSDILMMKQPLWPFLQSRNSQRTSRRYTLFYSWMGFMMFGWRKRINCF